MCLLKLGLWSVYTFCAFMVYDVSFNVVRLPLVISSVLALVFLVVRRGVDAAIPGIQLAHEELRARVGFLPGPERPGHGLPCVKSFQ